MHSQNIQPATRDDDSPTRVPFLGRRRPGAPTFRWLSVLISLAIAGGAVSAQDDEKVGAVILVPSSMKAYADQMPKSLPFVGTVVDSCQAKVLVGASLDAAKKEANARFILQLHGYTHVAPNAQNMGGINRLQYSLYYRPADDKKPAVLLGKSTADLGPGSLKTDKTILKLLGWSVGTDLADALAPKIVDAKAAPFTLLLGNALPAKRNAFPVTYAKDDKGVLHGRLPIKNRLPVRIEVGKLVFVPEQAAKGKQPVGEREPGTLFVEFKKARLNVAPNETGNITWPEEEVGPDNRYARILHLQLIEP